MFIRFCVVTVLLSITLSAWGSLTDAERSWANSSGPASWRRMVIQLVDAGYPFSAVPFMKEFLTQNREAIDENLDKAFDQMVARTGVRPFETLPDSVLEQSRSSIVRYILAKKHFRRGKYDSALNELARVNPNHPVYPFAIHLRAATHGVLGKHSEAEADYRDCVNFSRTRYNAESNPVKLRQLLFNRDSCVAGLARTAFNRGKYQEADSLYLDIPKSSFIWPEILAEEAWNSYYLKNYNRTLGKLVSYKAPVFDFVFNPEIDVLRSLAFLRLCLYRDVNDTVEGFYTNWLEPSKELRAFIVSHGKDYSYYYRLLNTFEKERTSKDNLMNSLMLSIIKDPAWHEMKQSLFDAVTEFNALKASAGSSRFKNVLMRNLKNVADDYQYLLGSYGKAQFDDKYNQLSRAFQGMSYIKLEVLSRKKQALYDDVKLGTKRGDVKYIERNDKQYFWDFNGEFWADELGDYVFALRSEC